MSMVRLPLFSLLIASLVVQGPTQGAMVNQQNNSNGSNILEGQSDFITADDVLNSSNIPKSKLNDVNVSDLNNYTVSIYINHTARIADVSFKLQFKNPTGKIMDNFFLNHALLSYESNFLTDRQKNTENYPWGFEDIQLNYENMTINNNDANFSIYGTALNISLPMTINPDEVFEVKFNFRASIPNNIRRYGAMSTSNGETVLVLAHLIPSFPVYENGNWRTDAFRFIADPFYAEVANYLVEINHHKDFIIGATGNLIEETSLADDRQLSLYSAIKVRDFAFAGSTDFIKEVLNATMPSGRIIPVTSLYQPSFADLYQDQAEYGISALEYFSQNLVEYAYDQITIVQTIQAFGGMEYPQWVTVSVGSGVEGVVAHELAHQWNYVMVGSDQFNEGWLDEGLTTFLANMYQIDKGQISLERLNTDRFTIIDLMNLGQIPINNTENSLTNFGGILQYTASAMVFHDFMNTIGRDLMFYILGNYYRENRYLIVDAAQFVDEFVQSLDQDWPLAYFDFMWNSPIPRAITPSAELFEYGCNESGFLLNVSVSNPGIMQRIRLHADVNGERIQKSFYINNSIVFTWFLPDNRIDEIKVIKLGFTFADTFPETLFTSVQYREFPPNCEITQETSSSTSSSVTTTSTTSTTPLTTTAEISTPTETSSDIEESQLNFGFIVLPFLFLIVVNLVTRSRDKTKRQID